MNIATIIDKQFGGCVFVSQHGRTLFESALGYADFANKIPNTLDTKFATASAGKVFVATSILQLIEKGILHFDDTLGDLINFNLEKIDPAITIEQLLNHTSGIPDYFDESVMEEYEELWVDFPNYKIRTNRDLLPLFIHKDMMYPRGERFQYNNTGYVMLAIILESKTQMPFDEYIHQHIFVPCGMTDSGYYELDRLPAKCATNYIYDNERKEYRTNIFSVDAKGTGAGGAYVTIHDIQLFWEALLSGKLLTKEMVATMLTNHSGEAECYGYGLWLKKSGDTYIPYFQGCDPGVSFISSYDQTKEQLIIAVSNYGDNVWKLHKELQGFLNP